jgi:branched-chain amino acid transport system permease protein
MTTILQTLVSGLALGSLYAVLALGFVVVVRASDVLNLAQGTFAAMGAYLCYSLANLGVSFWVALILTMVIIAIVGVLVEAFIVHNVSSDLFVAILITFGISIMVPPIIAAIWGSQQLTLHDPWALSTTRFGLVSIANRDLWLICATIVLFLAFFIFFRFTRLGLNLRATAMDSEAALAQGVSTRFVFGLSWALAGALGAFAGVMLATAGGGGVRPGLDNYALLALPIIILGGLESPLGAVIGGVIIGVTQQFTAIMVSPFLGSGFSDLVPYLVMIIILVIKPTGLFGAQKVRRV